MNDRQALEDEFQRLIDYSFRTHSLLEETLKSAGSAVSDPNIQGDRHGNKRLALLGDAVLSMMLLSNWYHTEASTGKYANLY